MALFINEIYGTLKKEAQLLPILFISQNEGRGIQFLQEVKATEWKAKIQY